MSVRASTQTGSKQADTAARSALRRRTLSHLIAMALTAGALNAHAAAPPAFSPSWFAQKQGQVGSAQQNPSGNAGIPGGANTAGNVLLQKNVQQSIANLNNAAQAVAAQIAAQKAAASAAANTPSNVPNGIAAGGLQVAAKAGTDPSLWQNANAPTQTTAGGQTTVEIKQTDQKAILTWDSFNVGRQTTVYFNQSAGNQSNGDNTWIALNRINDPSGSPSQILGQIKAEGTVYLLNRNGMIFGAGSTVNTHSLVASSLDLFSSDIATSNKTFLSGGLGSTSDILVSQFNDTANHDVVIEKGASITTGAQGFALVAAPNVSNAGSIIADDGQAILAATTRLSNATPNGTLQVYLGTDLANFNYLLARGTAQNSGLIQSRRGQVHLLGFDVDQDGVALASTSISHPGSVELRAQDLGQGPGAAVPFLRSGTLTLAPGSVTAVLPEKDGTTTSSSAAADQAFVSGRIDLAGGMVTIADQSLVEAPGASLNVAAIVDQPSKTISLPPTMGRIYIDSGAILDVSGLADVELPMSALLVDIPRIGQNELADSPLLRNSFLYTQKDILVDSSQQGTRPDGLAWVGSPILNVAGYVENVPRDISQMLTRGGSIGLSGSEVIVRSGAQVNLDGGYLAYQAGWVTTPNLLGGDGRIYNIATADPNVDYVGFAGQYTATHARWGVSQTFNSPLLAGTRRWDDGFIVGSDAGTLNIQADNALALDGDISAVSYAGRNQVSNGTQPEGGQLSIGPSPYVAIKTSTVQGILLQQSSLVIDDLVSGFQSDTPWEVVLKAQDPTATADDDKRLWLNLSADMVARAGFADVTLQSGSGTQGGWIREGAGTTLQVRPGGSINLTGSRIDIFGELSAPAGAIQLTATGPFLPFGAPNNDSNIIPSSITVGDGGLLSTRGLWVNDSGLTADTGMGDRYINGGSISLTTNQTLRGDPLKSLDGTGSIMLQSGSVLDVSGGGYVGTNGEVLTSHGAPVGHGGNIALTTYGGPLAFGVNSNSPTSLTGGNILLGGELLGYGFSGGGDFSLQAPEIQIGGDASAMALANGLYLDPAFFAGKGFDRYTLNSVTDATIASGATVNVVRDNLIPDFNALRTAASGTDLYATDQAHPSGIYASIGTLDAYHRWATRNTADGQGPGFSLDAGAYLGWHRVSNPAAPAPQYTGVSGALMMDTGSSVSVDAGGSVSLGSARSATVLGAISAPGGAIDVATMVVSIAPPITPYVWLGSQASLDASGVSLIDTQAAAVSGWATGAQAAFTPRTGTVLPGGSVSLTGLNGYVLAEEGSRIDVSGAADSFDLPTASTRFGGATVDYTATPVWSDAGSIAFSAVAGLYADATLVAHGGAADAEGGSLSIVGLSNTRPNSINATGVLLQQSGNLLPAGLQSGGFAEAGGPSGILHFAVDRLTDSGISSFNIGPATSPASGQRVVPIGFAGDVDISLGRAFTANASAYLALPDGSANLATTAGSYAQGNGTVHIAAPYVNLSGSTAGAPVARAGDGVLQVNADFIDIGGWVNLQQWADASFTSSGDIRFYLDPDTAYVNGVVQPGLLFSTGDLSFKAAQLYPASDYRFVIDANASGIADASGQARDTTVSILPNGPSDTPLSAGGALLVSATHIEQEGTIRVPSGTLVLGVRDPAAQAADFGIDPTMFPLAVTQSVHLADASVTSVSLGGITVPYGTTIDGTEWRYSGDPNSDSNDLSGPPTKQISINGSNLSLDKGAGIDLSGGGALQAEEWVPGVGGTRDTLAQFSTDPGQGGGAGAQVPQYADGRAIYAIVPGYHAPLAAHDAALEKGAGSGPAVGQAVYLAGVPGLPDGTYTLLPAKYATLPGAFRVVQDTSAIDGVVGRTAVQTDGTISTVGYFADALNGAHASRNTTFLLQSSAVWQQYSQYTLTDADTFFDNLASKAGTVAPFTPVDAGRLVLSAGQSLDLGATLTANPADGGRSSQVDIAAQAIQILGAGETARDGYLVLSADGLSTLGAGSLLIGGTRSLDGGGDRIDSVADSVVLSNDSAHPLAGQEIMLVARGSADAGAEGVLVESGSVLQARGNGNTAGTQPIEFGSDPTTDASGKAVAGVSGDGSMLRVSENGAATVTRFQVPGVDGVAGTSQGRLTLEGGAQVDGGNALTLDATGATQVDPTAVFSAKAIDVNSNLITFVGDDTAVNAAGLVIGPHTLDLFRGAQEVTLRSRGTIDFLGDVDISLANTLNLNAGALVGDGGQVTVEAGVLGFGNALGAAVPTFAAGSGRFTAKADEIDFGAGDTTLQGFGGFSATANHGMAGQGTGSMDFGTLDVTLDTPVFIAESGADTSLRTTGAMVLGSAAGTALQRDILGGALSISGGTLTVGTNLLAAAGNLDLSASAGDLNVLAGSSLSTAGINKTFFDTTTYAPGGALTLAATGGSVNIQTGAALAFGGAAQGGDAGSLSVSATGQVVLNGGIDGHASDGYLGGYFTLVSGDTVDLDGIVDLANTAGLTGMVNVTSGAGNLVLSAGKTLTALKVYLTANGGTSPGANDGNVAIDGTIDTSSTSGSHIELYGNSGVDIEGKLLATSSIAAQRGGDVVIGTSGVTDGTLNTSYGYENVQSSGSGFIHLGANALIDVSGGSADASSGGTVSMRAPLLADGDVRIAIDGGGSSIVGARSVTIEPYAVWSTADGNTDNAKHFDGVIDPSGWYQLDGNGKPALVAGKWADASGNVLAAPADDTQLQQYLSADYFIPDQANADHQSFYGYIAGDASKGPGTLMGFVEQPAFAFGDRYAGIANLAVRPGIELRSPANGSSSGDISVLTNWNLGAGVTNTDGSIALAYRYQGQAPILTVRAANNLDIEASISDGFYQQNDGAVLSDPPAPPPPPVTDNGYADALAAYQVSLQYMTANGIWNGTINLKAGTAANGMTPGGPTISITSDPYYKPLQAPLQDQSANYYTNYDDYISEIGNGTNTAWAAAFNNKNTIALRRWFAYNPTSLAAPEPTGNYADYVSAYQTWLTTNFATNPVAKRLQTPSPIMLPVDPDYTAYTVDYAEYIAGHKAYYTYVDSKVGTIGGGGQLYYAPFAPRSDPTGSPAYLAALAAYQSSQAYFDANGIWNGTINLKAGTAANGMTPGGPTINITSDPYYQPLQAPLQDQSANYYTNYDDYISEIGNGTNTAWAAAFNNKNTIALRRWFAYNPTSLAAPLPATFGNYADYVSAYQTWLTANFATNPVAKRLQTPSPIMLPVDPDYTAYTVDYAEYITGHKAYYTYVDSKVGTIGGGGQLYYAPFAPKSDAAPVGGGGGGGSGTVIVPPNSADNSPSNMSGLGSATSFASATLLGGSSSSYRLVAGADMDSSDPLALSMADAGNVGLDGHFAVTDTLTDPAVVNVHSPFAGKTLLFPTTIRTGTGSIDIAAGGDIDWLDDAAPAAIYTAGAPAAGTSAGTDVSVIRPSETSSATTTPDMLVTGLVNPEHAGDISLSARGNIDSIGQVVDTDGSITKGPKGTDIEQFWWPWMQVGNAADGSRSSIDFANFAQGVMSVGGNVSVNAGGDITQLSVSLPTTWYANAARTSITTVGGGNLDVQAGGDILSGSYFVAKGQGRIDAGGRIAADYDYTTTGALSTTLVTPVSTILAMQDAQVDVSARLGADIGGVFDPSYYSTSAFLTLLPAQHADMQGFSADSSLGIETTTGDLSFGSLRTPGALFSYGGNNGFAGPILPASLSLTSLSGDIDILTAGELYPSADGNLNLLADGSIRFSRQTSGDSTSQAFGLIDSPASSMPSPLQPGTFGSSNQGSIIITPASNTAATGADPLHGDDDTPVRIYALDGDIVDGATAPNGFNFVSLVLSPAKQALVYAGRDIVNLSFIGQHTHAADITRIAAGRDIYDTPLLADFGWGSYILGGYELVPSLVLGGPGNFLVEAGRNIGPLTNETETTKDATTRSSLTGIDAVGNLFNPNLPHESANINVAFGVGPGVDTAAFITQYMDTPAGADGFGDLTPDLVAFMNQRVAGQVIDTGFARDKQVVALSPEQARALFDQQPEYVQRLFAEQELFKILATVGSDFNDPASKFFNQYQRGYAAIDTLFPASLGYTANGLGQGGLNGAAQTVDTGDLDIRSSTIQTQQGGDISIIGPGGQALLGSTAAPPQIVDTQGNVLAGPNTMGVLTLEQGDVNMFTDRSVLLAQSRIFTEQGGDLVMWSSNGDINAGQGAKTTAEIPPPTYLCTVDAWCRIDARGQVSGAGIGTLQTIPGAPEGSVFLIAPRGTVDAGDAGIRVSGNLVIAAARVANADNIQVKGDTIGVPVTAAVNIGALNAAGAAANAASRVAEDVARKQQSDARDRIPSIISVQILGFGDNTTSIQSVPGQGTSYDPASPVQVLGTGRLSASRKNMLTLNEQKQLAE